ncbi:toxin [Xenorhabdus budapestensis]|uniref:Toxin n=1 Tax=Xenorhabdus budapestensis TaxID=290110 RepID=A0ABX7VDM0_XENBU|nr:Tc toxin subunit A [Xenorhabdus budapestensis]QTL38605.1 toxin [Xenorhabdus budapestensis]
MSKNRDYSDGPQNMKKVSPLLAVAAEIPLSNLALTKKSTFPQEEYSSTTFSLVDALKNLGYHSIFDIVSVSKQRFVKRHNQSLTGHAEIIFDKAVSMANQLVQHYRQNSLRQHDREKASFRISGAEYQDAGGQVGKLPDYSSLFPEPWDNFCQPDAIESLDSPANYLLDLYKFVQQIEVDGTNQARVLATRREDISQLMLDSEALYKEVRALTIVNNVLSESARKYIDQTGEATKPVNQVLGETRFPFTLPYNLATQQINRGLAENNTELGAVIQQVDTQFPWSTGTAKNHQTLLAYTQLSNEQIEILTEPAHFSENLLSRDQLMKSYYSGSTTELVPEKDISRHAYIVAQEEGINGPTKLVENSPNAYDTISITCKNQAGKTITIKLRAENVLTYYRIKARMVPFDNSPPFSRQLKLTYLESDNPDIGNLDEGPYFANMTIYAAIPAENNQRIGQVVDQIDGVVFRAMSYRLAIAKSGTPSSELSPQSNDFFENNYGLSEGQSVQLKQLTVFGDQTNTKVTELENLFSSGKYRPIVSPHVHFSNTIFSSEQTSATFPAPYHYGGVYINAGQRDALEIIRTDDGREIKAVSQFRYDRLNRFIRLQRWFDLPYHQLDLLLASGIKAETNNLDMRITDNILKLLGLFRHLNVQYKVTAEMFASWLYQVTPFSISDNVPFFDQLFNQTKLFDQPLVLDNTEFNYMATQGDDAKTIKQLCAGLGISSVTFQLIAPLVENVYTPIQSAMPGRLKRNLDVVSSLYRLVSIPRTFGLSTEDGLILADILTNDHGYLAKPPVFPLTNTSANSAEQNNLLIFIMKMEIMSAWLVKSKMTAAKLSLMLGKTVLPVVPTDSMVTFFKGIAAGLSENVLLSSSDFIRPELVGIDWWTLLTGEHGLLNQQGLVLDIPPEWNKTEENQIREKVKALFTEEGAVSDNAINIVAQLLIQAKNAQDNLLSSAIAAEYGVEKSLVPLQLCWLGSNVYQVLNMILAGVPETAADLSSQFTDLTYSLLIYTQIINTLKINKNLLLLRLTKPEWLGVLNNKTSNSLSLDEIYSLTRYQDLVSSANQNEDKLYDYFTYANEDHTNQLQSNQSQPNRKTARNGIDDHSETCADILADILGWDANEIYLACTLRALTPPQAQNLLHIDWLRRLQQLATSTNLSVKTLWDASELTISTDFNLYQSVGEAVMAALKAQGDIENV